MTAGGPARAVVTSAPILQGTESGTRRFVSEVAASIRDCLLFSGRLHLCVLNVLIAGHFSVSLVYCVRRRSHLTQFYRSGAIRSLHEFAPAVRRFSRGVNSWK